MLIHGYVLVVNSPFCGKPQYFACGLPQGGFAWASGASQCFSRITYSAAIKTRANGTVCPIGPVPAGSRKISIFFGQSLWLSIE
jgi:hypothetical protein